MESISSLISELGDWSRGELAAEVEVIEASGIPDKGALFVEARKWLRIEDVVVVVGDLAASTKLNVRKHTKTSCRIYEAATGGAVRIITQPEFGPEFVDIQGDGFFALFHGPLAYERGFCAATTLRTWSERELVPAIEKLGPRIPPTGFKLGMARGVLAVKNVGVPRTSYHEPVWAGKPVNWGFKCAQAAERHNMIVTEHVHEKFRGNDFIRYSCGCDGAGGSRDPRDLWQQVAVDAIGDDSFDCHRLNSAWCAVHGDETCRAILAGETVRADIPAHVRAA